MVPKQITIHCSDSPNGQDVGTAEIRKWHTDPPPKGRGWSDIGYHRVMELDGGIGEGRREDREGAHVEGHNSDNLGICVVGRDRFTMAQFTSLRQTVMEWMGHYGISIENLRCHYEFDTAIAQGKTCPNMKIEDLRAFVQGNMEAIKQYLISPS